MSSGFESVRGGKFGAALASVSSVASDAGMDTLAWCADQLDSLSKVIAESGRNSRMEKVVNALNFVSLLETYRLSSDVPEHVKLALDDFSLIGSTFVADCLDLVSDQVDANQRGGSR